MRGDQNIILEFFFIPKQAHKCCGSISTDYFQAYIYSSAIDNLSLLRVHEWSSH